MSETSAWQQGHTRALMGMPKGRTPAQAATSSERTRSQSTSSTRRPSGPPPARYTHASLRGASNPPRHVRSRALCRPPASRLVRASPGNHTHSGRRPYTCAKKHAASLNHSRALYVISANMEKKSVYKIGIAGTTQAKPIRRFESYIIAYGKYDNTNSCRGVLIHFCGVTEYNRRVLANKSQVAQVELKLKQDLKTTGSLALGRGTERVLTTKKSMRVPQTKGGQTRNEHPYVYGFRQLGFVNRVYCARFVAG